MWFKRWDVVLFLHHGLGDLVMAVPMLEELKRSCDVPKMVLVFVKCRDSLRLLEVLGIAEIFQVKIFSRRFAFLYPLTIGVRYPKVILAPQSCGDWRMPLLLRLTLCGFSVGPATQTFGPGFSRTLPSHDSMAIHKTDYYIRFLELAGYQVHCNGRRESFRLPSHFIHSATMLLSDLAPAATKWYCFTPGSTERERHKRWPYAYYAALAQRLIQEQNGSHIIIIGSKSEMDLMERIKNSVDCANRVHVVTPTDIGVSLAIFSKCTCVVSGCNGPSHMAGLVGAPLVSIYGPTNPGNTGAWAPIRRVLRADVACAPCYRWNFVSGCTTPICMKIVTPDEVYKAVEYLSKNGGCDPLPWCGDSGATEASASAFDRLKMALSEPI